MTKSNLITSHEDVPDLEYQHLSQKLYQLENDIPSDSSLRAEVEHDQNGWQINLSVHYSRGHMAVMEKNVDFDLALEEACNQMHERVLLWRKTRDLELFHLDNATESDFFTQLESSDMEKEFENMRILLVEDDPAASHVIEAIFRKSGCQVKSISDPQKAIREMQEGDYNLIILDWNLPYVNGGEILLEADKSGGKKLKPTDRPVPVVVCSSLPREQITFPKVENFYAFEYWDKTMPFSSALQTIKPSLRKLNKKTKDV